MLGFKPAHPIKGGGSVVEGHSGDINQRASNEGHSRQAVVIPFYSCVEQVFAVFILKRFPLMMHTLVMFLPDISGPHSRPVLL